MAADPDSSSQPYDDGEDMMMMRGSSLDIKHEIPLATIDSYDDLLCTPFESVTSTPARRLDDVTKDGEDSDDDISDVSIVYPRMRTTFRVIAAASILIIIGFLFLMAALILSSDPVEDYPAYIIIGGVFISVGALILIVKIVWCKVQEKRINQKISQRIKDREQVYQISGSKDHPKYTKMSTGEGPSEDASNRELTNAIH